MGDNKSSIELKPEVAFITGLIKQLKSGKLRIPKFQRAYVWNKSQILDLFDSIYHMYPIGSLLIWETDQAMGYMEHLGPLEIPEPTEGEKYGYILDGQQRLTTLAVALGGDLFNNENSDWDHWRVYFDLEEDQFTYLRKKNPDINYFPLSVLTDTFRFLEQCKKFQDSSNTKSQLYMEKAVDLAERIMRTYTLPIVTIKDTTLNESVKIFSRLNSAGTKISDDQMVAALSFRQDSDGSDAFNLSEIITEVVNSLEASNFRDTSRALVLRAILGEMGLDVYRTSWDTLVNERISDLEKAAGQVLENFEFAVQFLKNEGITSESLLPYEMQLVLISIFYKFYRNKKNKSALDTLKRWFWVSSFLGWFAFGNATTIRRAILDLEKMANGQTDKFDSIDLSEPVKPLPISFNFRAGRTRAFCIFLMSLKPRNFENGEILDEGEVLSHGYKSYPYILRKTNAIGNQHSGPENRILLGQKFYPNELDRKGVINELLFAGTLSNLDEVLLSHGIDNEARMAFESIKMSDFLHLRRSYLEKKEIEFMMTKGVTPPSDNGSGDYSMENEFDE